MINCWKLSFFIVYDRRIMNREELAKELNNGEKCNKCRLFALK